MSDSNTFYALNCLRQTGRTTRMLEEAVKVANEGVDVVIVADNVNQQRMIGDSKAVVEFLDYHLGSFGQINIPCHLPLSGVKARFAPPARSITIIVPPEGTDILKMNKLWIGQENQATFIDHDVIERRLADVLHMLYAGVDSVYIRVSSDVGGSSFFESIRSQSFDPLEMSKDLKDRCSTPLTKSEILEAAKHKKLIPRAVIAEAFKEELKILHKYDKYVLLPTN